MWNDCILNYDPYKEAVKRIKEELDKKDDKDNEKK